MRCIFASFPTLSLRRRPLFNEDNKRKKRRMNLNQQTTNLIAKARSLSGLTNVLRNSNRCNPSHTLLTCNLQFSDTLAQEQRVLTFRVVAESRTGLTALCLVVAALQAASNLVSRGILPAHCSKLEGVGYLCASLAGRACGNGSMAGRRVKKRAAGGIAAVG